MQECLGYFGHAAPGTADSDPERATLMARAQTGDRKVDYGIIEQNHSVSVRPLFSPSRATVPAAPFPSATAVVELEASVFEPVQKPRNWQKIGVPQ
jgi:hypothetical protein